MCIRDRYQRRVHGGIRKVQKKMRWIACLVLVLLALVVFAEDGVICIKNAGCGNCATTNPPPLCGVRQYFQCAEWFDCAVVDGKCTMTGKDRFSQCLTDLEKKDL
eukprot:TRINITY_DN1438_c0_g3_i1.p1 TRINITY_DN1438_c0_g3~~TRINITY_DN1438_c0_g3_i1.p1  ORF type:complete len:105 (-),score=16.36 TRINITY_DN1438_c0_g3_i1:104-418(-)